LIVDNYLVLYSIFLSPPLNLSIKEQKRNRNFCFYINKKKIKIFNVTINDPAHLLRVESESERKGIYALFTFSK